MNAKTSDPKKMVLQSAIRAGDWSCIENILTDTQVAMSLSEQFDGSKNALFYIVENGKSAEVLGKLISHRTVKAMLPQLLLAKNDKGQVLEEFIIESGRTECDVVIQENRKELSVGGAGLGVEKSTPSLVYAADHCKDVVKHLAEHDKGIIAKRSVLKKETREREKLAKPNAKAKKAPLLNKKDLTQKATKSLNARLKLIDEKVALDKDGRSVLHVAMEKGDDKALTAILRDFNLLMSQDISTLLEYEGGTQEEIETQISEARERFGEKICHMKGELYVDMRQWVNKDRAELSEEALAKHPAPSLGSLHEIAAKIVDGASEQIIKGRVAFNDLMLTPNKGGKMLVVEALKRVNSGQLSKSQEEVVAGTIYDLVVDSSSNKRLMQHMVHTNDVVGLKALAKFNLDYCLASPAEELDRSLEELAEHNQQRVMAEAAVELFDFLGTSVPDNMSMMPDYGLNPDLSKAGKGLVSIIKDSQLSKVRTDTQSDIDLSQDMLGILLSNIDNMPSTIHQQLLIELVRQDKLSVVSDNMWNIRDEIYYTLVAPILKAEPDEFRALLNNAIIEGNNEAAYELIKIRRNNEDYDVAEETATGAKGKNIFHIALENNNELFVDYIKMVDCDEYNRLINKQDSQGRTPRELLKSNAQIPARGSEEYSIQSDTGNNDITAEELLAAKRNLQGDKITDIKEFLNKNPNLIYASYNGLSLIEIVHDNKRPDIVKHIMHLHDELCKEKEKNQEKLNNIENQVGIFVENFMDSERRDVLGARPDIAMERALIVQIANANYEGKENISPAKMLVQFIQSHNNVMAKKLIKDKPEILQNRVSVKGEELFPLEVAMIYGNLEIMDAIEEVRKERDLGEIIREEEGFKVVLDMSNAALDVQSIKVINDDNRVSQPEVKDNKDEMYKPTSLMRARLAAIDTGEIGKGRLTKHTQHMLNDKLESFNDLVVDKKYDGRLPELQSEDGFNLPTLMAAYGNAHNWGYAERKWSKGKANRMADEVSALGAPLHVAVAANRPEMVQLLLTDINAKASPNIRDADGNTPLHLALMDSNVGITNIYLNSLKARNLSVLDSLLQVNTQGVSVFELALANENQAIVSRVKHELTTASKSDLEKMVISSRKSGKGSRDYDNIIHKLAANGSADDVALVLDLMQTLFSSEFDLMQSRNTEGETPLDVALKNGNKEVFNLFVENSLTQFQDDRNKVAALLSKVYASPMTDMQLVAQLSDSMGYSPLAVLEMQSVGDYRKIVHVLVDSGNPEVLDYMLKSALMQGGKDLTAILDNEGKTVFDHACKCGDLNKLHMLLEYNYNMNLAQPDYVTLSPTQVDAIDYAIGRDDCPDKLKNLCVDLINEAPQEQIEQIFDKALLNPKLLEFMYDNALIPHAAQANILSLCIDQYVAPQVLSYLFEKAMENERIDNFDAQPEERRRMYAKLADVSISEVMDIVALIESSNRPEGWALLSDMVEREVLDAQDLEKEDVEVLYSAVLSMVQHCKNESKVGTVLSNLAAKESLFTKAQQEKLLHAAIASGESGNVAIVVDHSTFTDAVRFKLIKEAAKGDDEGILMALFGDHNVLQTLGTGRLNYSERYINSMMEKGQFKALHSYLGSLANSGFTDALYNALNHTANNRDEGESLPTGFWDSYKGSGKKTMIDYIIQGKAAKANLAAYNHILGEDVNKSAIEKATKNHVSDLAHNGEYELIQESKDSYKHKFEAFKGIRDAAIKSLHSGSTNKGSKNVDQSGQLRRVANASIGLNQWRVNERDFLSHDSMKLTKKALDEFDLRKSFRKAIANNDGISVGRLVRQGSILDSSYETLTTPMEDALQTNNLDIVLACAPHCDLTIADGEGNTVLHNIVNLIAKDDNPDKHLNSIKSLAQSSTTPMVAATNNHAKQSVLDVAHAKLGPQSKIYQELEKAAKTEARYLQSINNEFLRYSGTSSIDLANKIQKIYRDAPEHGRERRVMKTAINKQITDRLLEIVDSQIVDEGNASKNRLDKMKEFFKYDYMDLFTTDGNGNNMMHQLFDKVNKSNAIGSSAALMSVVQTLKDDPRFNMELMSRKNRDGLTPIDMLAGLKNSVALFQELEKSLKSHHIAANVDLNAVVRRSVAAGDTELCDYLCNNTNYSGVKATNIDSSGKSALFYVGNQGVGVVEGVLKSGVDINQVDLYGRNALHDILLQSYNGNKAINPDLVALLVLRGANINHKDHNGLSALDLMNAIQSKARVARTQYQEMLNKVAHGIKLKGQLNDHERSFIVALKHGDYAKIAESMQELASPRDRVLMDSWKRDNVLDFTEKPGTTAAEKLLDLAESSLHGRATAEKELTESLARGITAKQSLLPAAIRKRLPNRIPVMAFISGGVVETHIKGKNASVPISALLNDKVAAKLGIKSHVVHFGENGEDCMTVSQHANGEKNYTVEKGSVVLNLTGAGNKPKKISVKVYADGRVEILKSRFGQKFSTKDIDKLKDELSGLHDRYIGGIPISQAIKDGLWREVRTREGKGLSHDDQFKDKYEETEQYIENDKEEKSVDKHKPKIKPKMVDTGTDPGIERFGVEIGVGTDDQNVEDRGVQTSPPEMVDKSVDAIYSEIDSIDPIIESAPPIDPEAQKHRNIATNTDPPVFSIGHSANNNFEPNNDSESIYSEVLDFDLDDDTYLKPVIDTEGRVSTPAMVDIGVDPDTTPATVNIGTDSTLSESDENESIYMNTGTMTVPEEPYGPVRPGDRALRKPHTINTGTNDNIAVKPVVGTKKLGSIPELVDDVDNDDELSMYDGENKEPDAKPELDDQNPDKGGAPADTQSADSGIWSEQSTVGSEPEEDTQPILYPIKVSLKHNGPHKDKLSDDSSKLIDAAKQLSDAFVDFAKHIPDYKHHPIIKGALQLLEVVSKDDILLEEPAIVEKLKPALIDMSKFFGEIESYDENKDASLKNGATEAITKMQGALLAVSLAAHKKQRGLEDKYGVDDYPKLEGTNYDKLYSVAKTLAHDINKLVDGKSVPGNVISDAQAQGLADRFADASGKLNAQDIEQKRTEQLRSLDGTGQHSYPLGDLELVFGNKRPDIASNERSYVAGDEHSIIKDAHKLLDILSKDDTLLMDSLITPWLQPALGDISRLFTIIGAHESELDEGIESINLDDNVLTEVGDIEKVILALQSNLHTMQDKLRIRYNVKDYPNIDGENYDQLYDVVQSFGANVGDLIESKSVQSGVIIAAEGLENQFAYAAEQLDKANAKQLTTRVESLVAEQSDGLSDVNKFNVSETQQVTTEALGQDNNQNALTDDLLTQTTNSKAPSLRQSEEAIAKEEHASYRSVKRNEKLDEVQQNRFKLMFKELAQAYSNISEFEQDVLPTTGIALSKARAFIMQESPQKLGKVLNCFELQGGDMGGDEYKALTNAYQELYNVHYKTIHETENHMDILGDLQTDSSYRNNVEQALQDLGSYVEEVKQLERTLDRSSQQWQSIKSVRKDDSARKKASKGSATQHLEEAIIESTELKELLTQLDDKILGVKFVNEQQIIEDILSAARFIFPEDSVMLSTVENCCALWRNGDTASHLVEEAVSGQFHINIDSTEEQLNNFTDNYEQFKNTLRMAIQICTKDAYLEEVDMSQFKATLHKYNKLVVSDINALTGEAASEVLALVGKEMLAEVEGLKDSMDKWIRGESAVDVIENIPMTCILSTKQAESLIEVKKELCQLCDDLNRQKTNLQMPVAPDLSSLPTKCANMVLAEVSKIGQVLVDSASPEQQAKESLKNALLRVDSNLQNSNGVLTNGQRALLSAFDSVSNSSAASLKSGGAVAGNALDTNLYQCASLWANGKSANIIIQSIDDLGQSHGVAKMNKLTNDINKESATYEYNSGTAVQTESAHKKGR